MVPLLASEGFSLRRLADTNRTSEQEQALHVYLARDDVMFDVRGRQSETSYIQGMRDYRQEYGGPVPDFRSIECSEEELFLPIPRDTDLERGPRNRWCHILDPEFLAECRTRARRLIQLSPGRYCFGGG
jgi:hypothetical protein